MAEKELRRDPNREPTHPGALLREDVLPAIGDPVMAVAKKLGVTRQHLHRVLDLGQHRVGADEHTTLARCAAYRLDEVHDGVEELDRGAVLV